MHGATYTAATVAWRPSSPIHTLTRISPTRLWARRDVTDSLDGRRDVGVLDYWRWTFDLASSSANGSATPTMTCSRVASSGAPGVRSMSSTSSPQCRTPVTTRQRSLFGAHIPCQCVRPLFVLSWCFVFVCMLAMLVSGSADWQWRCPSSLACIFLLLSVYVFVVVGRFLIFLFS